MFALQYELLELVLQLVCMLIHVHKTQYSLYSKCMHMCMTNGESKPNRQSRSAPVSAPYSPVEVQSGVTHGNGLEDKWNSQ